MLLSVAWDALCSQIKSISSQEDNNVILKTTTSDKNRYKANRTARVMQSIAIPQTDLSILCDVRMPYSGQTSHFRRLQINMNDQHVDRGKDKSLLKNKNKYIVFCLQKDETNEEKCFVTFRRFEKKTGLD